VRRSKPWFGPAPFINPMTGIRSPIWPLSWQGVVVMFALILGLGMAKWGPDHVRGAIAAALVVVAFAVIVYLTWDRDPD
jgi:hypothetical protein